MISNYLRGRKNNRSPGGEMMIKWMRNDGKNRGEIMTRNDGKMK